MTMRASIGRWLGVIKQPAIGNTLWLLADKGLRVVLLMTVTALMARILGPDEFGKFSFVQALVLLIGIFANFGLENVVVRDIVRWPERRAEILASAFVLRFIGGAVAAVACPLAMAILRPADSSAWIIAAVLGASLLPQAAEVIVYGYQAQVNAKPVVLLRNASLAICSLLRIILLVKGYGLIPLAATLVIEPALFALLLIRRTYRDRMRFALKDATRIETTRLVREGWPLMVSMASIAIYMRIDQVMLARMQGDYAAGVLSAAVKVSEVWHAVPVALLASFSPTLVAAFHNSSQREYEQALLRVARLVVILAVACCVLLTALASVIIGTLYGKAFLAAAEVVSVHVWSGLFVTLGLVGSNWMVTTGKAHFIMWQTMVGAAVNVVLNLLLIPVYGPIGTAIATVVSQAIASVFCHGLFEESRPIFRLQLRALGIPIK